MAFYLMRSMPVTYPTGFLLLIMMLILIGCGGGSGEEDVAGSTREDSETGHGIDFVHNGYYSEEELAEAITVVDEYYDAAVDCALGVYPELADVIETLPSSDLTVLVMYPDTYNPATGREGFSCEFSENGCAGTYKMGSVTIRITPSLDALGHEMSHWINHMLFGTTSDDDPEDLASLCSHPPICHLYSETKNLIACRN